MSHSVTLIFDPFGISDASGTAVFDARTEKDAFIRIDSILKRGGLRGSPEVVVVQGPSCAHFESYRARLRGVRTVEVTPQTELRKRFKSSPPYPDWLTDELIHDAGLLRHVPPDAGDCADWAASILRHLVPGIDDVAGLTEWLQLVAGASRFPEQMANTPVMDELVKQFAELCRNSVSSDEINERLTGELVSCSSPPDFAAQWLKRIALRPLIKASSSGYLPLPAGLEPTEDPITVFIAGQLPVAFPLPANMHQEVSALFVEAVRNARLRGHGSLERIALTINAWWEGVDEELRTWLAHAPRGLTSKAAAHLRSLPGFEGSRTASQLVEYYSPPPQVPPWPGLGEGFDTWVERYADFARSAFFRRDLPPPDEDPASGFGRWIKDNHTVSYEHPERGYAALARRAQAAVNSGRNLILVIVDALGIHVSRDLIQYLNDELGAPPTWASCLFAPVPTLTEICKQAILTGSYPDASGADLHAVVSEAYGLKREEVVLAADWRDAERVSIGNSHRLIVYRDNRIDERLKSVMSFPELLDDCANVFPRLAHAVARWERDMRHISGQRPLILLCADHGFTYGPSPSQDDDSQLQSRRCVVAESRERYAADPAATYIDRSRFHLKTDYAAAVGRTRGSGTVSGWSFSHGGLLPEEVLIPVVEWFGDIRALRWPELRFPSSAVYANNCWHVAVDVSNPTSMPMPGIVIAISRPASRERATASLPTIRPRSSHRLSLSVPALDSCSEDEVAFDVMLSVSRLDSETVTRQQQYSVPRERQLVASTQEQQDFEDMF